ncbi:MAG TPA: ATP synthase F1 subunit delta [Terriglobales bacterium]|nr:ATP synthase F1 subunit delta [Terriglobales bacterium]
MAAVTSRYARAFADVVFDSKLDVNVVKQQLHAILGLMGESVDLARVWENPSIPAGQKRNLLDAIGARVGLLKQVRNFLAVLIDHQRIMLLDHIVRQFEHELNERLGFAEAKITSARELSPEERRELELQITNLTGKRVLANYQTDSKLIGGAVVRIGSTIYDGSVRGQFEKIREQLSSQ